MSKIGFIGLGIMGRPMAGHLQKDGHELFLHDIVDLPKELLDGGGKECSSGKEVAEQSEIVIIMVPDTPHVEAVLFGENGVAEGLSPGQTVVDIVYSPRRTPLLVNAVNAGAHTVDGLGMLVHQAAIAFERWTGRSAPLDVMRSAVLSTTSA